jgi:hypothetical protein
MMNNKILSFFRIGTMWNTTSDNLTHSTHSTIRTLLLNFFSA